MELIYVVFGCLLMAWYSWYCTRRGEWLVSDLIIPGYIYIALTPPDSHERWHVSWLQYCLFLMTTGKMGRCSIITMSEDNTLQQHLYKRCADGRHRFRSRTIHSTPNAAKIKRVKPCSPDDIQALHDMNGKPYSLINNCVKTLLWSLFPNSFRHPL